MPDGQPGGALAGQRIILTSQRRADDFADALTRRGAVVIHAPTMSHLAHADDGELRARLTELVDAAPDVLVVTTGIGFRELLDAATTFGLAQQLRAALTGTRILVRGPKARGAVQAGGFTVEWTARSETAAEIVDHLIAEPLRGRRIAVQHHGAGSDGLDEALVAAGAEVVPLIVYRWGPPPDESAVARAVELTARGQVDCVAFTAAPGVRGFLDAARAAGVFDDVVAALRDGSVLAAAVGDTTAAPLRELGCRPVVPERFRMGALVRTITQALAPELTGVAHE